MRERVLFFQDLPWWVQRFGAMRVLGISPLRQFVHDGTLHKWMQLQLSYVTSLEGTCGSLMGGVRFHMPLGASPRAMIVNAILDKQVRSRRIGKV